MAATLAVTCPHCRKTLQIPDTAAGKRVKCKWCTEVFVATAPRSAKGQAGKGKDASDPKAKASAAKDQPKTSDDEEWGVVKAYGVTKESDKPHCPYCAWELEEEGQVVCLHCGYNLQTRERLEPKIYEPLTSWDWFFWLLPGILCGLVCLTFLGGIIYCIYILIYPWEGYEGSSTFRMFVIYTAVACGFVAFLSGRFAVKRLILNPRPPEREKRVKKEGEK
ncbi:MAG: zinc-ribbon domain-containing protein [Gemmatales bacterium]|nr:zinc-ribbon domain-containing protein [Gemmatales bacterium]MDW8385482.1 hypothetical protein [Gemmatales bacterium]